VNQELIPFKGNNIRVERDTSGEPGFCLQDICNALGIKKSRNVIGRLSSKEAFSKGILTDGGEQQMWFVNETGLYLVISGSRKPLAKELTAKLMGILPELRRGGLSITPLTQLDIMQQSLDILKRHESEISAIRTELNQYKEKQQTVTALLSPVKEVSTRMKLSQIIRDYACKNELPIRDCWTDLYYQFKYRYNVDLTIRAKNAGKSRLDIAEELHCLDDLFSLAITMYIGGK
jgi:prophage antirepressor-like protein